MTESERIEALENRVRILEALVAALIDSVEDGDDAPAPAEDMEGNPIPRAPSGW